MLVVCVLCCLHLGWVRVAYFLPLFFHTDTNDYEC